MSECQMINSTGPACEAKKLIIEVMGTAHPGAQAFRLFDASNEQQQEWLEGQVKEEKLDEQVLHVWPWEGKDKKNVWLDIPAVKGNPVRVPLFDGVESTPRQKDDQYNRIWPMVPITLLANPEPIPGHPDAHPVPVRPGFLYIFRNGQLWRELEVANSKTGHLSFQDVRLLDYRSANGEPLTEDRRPAVGKALEAVWLPVRGMACSLTASFELAFSEVQWSADRIAYLEADAEARSDRCTTPGNPKQPKEPEKAGQWAALAKLPAMRTRDSYLEQHLPQPWKSIYDLNGKHASDLYQKAVDEQEAFAEGGNAGETAWENANYPDSALRGASSVRLAALEAAQLSECTVSPLWQSLDTAKDALTHARQYGWGVLTLADPLFQMRQSLAQANDATQYLTLLTEIVGQQPHTDSAQLVYRVMGPDFLGGRENPLHGYLDSIDTSLFGKLHSTLHTAQRARATEDMALGQKRALAVLKRPDNQRALADLFTLKGADYIEGFALAQTIIQTLAMNPQTDDKLRINKANVEQAPVEQCHGLLFDILTEGSDQPLHRMLFPVTDGDETGPESVPENIRTGDGRCRPKNVGQLAQTTPDAGNLQTLSAAALAGIAKHKGLNLTTEAKRWAAAVNAVFDGIHKTAQAALMTLKSHAQQINAKLYAPLLSLGQARDPELLGAVKLVPRSAVPSDWVVLGVTDPEKGRAWGLTEAEKEEYVNKAGHRRFYGEFYPPDSDTPLATTNRKYLPDLAEGAEARDMHVYAAPASSEVTKAHRKLRRYQRWDEIAEHVRLPYFIVAIEVFNLWNENELFEKVLASRGTTRAYAGVASARIDLLLASSLAIERLLLNVTKWEGFSAKLESTAFSISHDLISRVSLRLADALPRIVSFRLLGGLVAGGLTLVISLMDMVHEMDTGDTDAAVAQGISAIGGGMMLMGGLMLSADAASATTVALLGLGPVGWVAIGVALAVGGGILAVVLDDPPLVDWLKRGPFGDEPDDEYEYLAHHPEETFYRLVGLLSAPRITLESIHDLNVRLAAKGISLTGPQDRSISQANYKVTITNNVTSLLDDGKLHAYLRLKRTVVRTSTLFFNSMSVKRKVLDTEPDILLEQPLPNGTAYYLALPPKTTENHWFSGSVTDYDVAVRAQWQATLDGGRQRHFPTPELSDPTRFNAAHNTKPDFTEDDQPFWANE